MHAKYSQGQQATLKIESLGIYGEGVARLDGMTCFVDGALPQETVQAKITEVRRNFYRATLLKILEPSPHRIDPICPLFGTCGGCQIMHLDYEEQLKTKRQRIIDAFERIGKLDGFLIAPTHPSPHPLYYRNKIQLPMNSSLQLGLYKKNSHQIIPIEQCFIHTPLGERVFQKVQTCIQKHALNHITYVLIKTALDSHKSLVIFVTPQAASKKLKSAAKTLIESTPEIAGVIYNLSPPNTNTILGPSCEVLAGSGFIEEKLCALTFRISPMSFFQVNPLQAECLYQKALEISQCRTDSIVLDAYCGVGTLSLIFASYAKQVIGIECIQEAIDDAKINASVNRITNTAFFCAKIEKIIDTLPSFDIALLNPPRKGCDPSVLQALAEKKPRTIIYISCDPATCARDLASLEKSGFTIDGAYPFDMFPQTAHVECLVKLTYHR